MKLKPLVAKLFYINKISAVLAQLFIPPNTEPQKRTHPAEKQHARGGIKGPLAKPGQIHRTTDWVTIQSKIVRNIYSIPTSISRSCVRCM